MQSPAFAGLQQTICFWVSRFRLVDVCLERKVSVLRCMIRCVVITLLVCQCNRCEVIECVVAGRVNYISRFAALQQMSVYYTAKSLQQTMQSGSLWHKLGGSGESVVLQNTNTLSNTLPHNNSEATHGL